MTAGMYMATVGKVGIRTLAQLNHDKAVFLKNKLEEAGFEVPFSRPFFNEFVVKVSDDFNAKERGLNKLPATSPPSPLSIAGEGEFG